MQVTVINLLRRPDRKLAFLKRHEAISELSFTFKEAVDGQTLSIEDARQSGILAPDCVVAPGHLACAMSHYQCLSEIVKSEQPGIVAEDDAVFRHDFAEQWQRLQRSLPEDWDMFLFGFNFDSFFMVELVPDLKAYCGFIGLPLKPKSLESFQTLTRPVGMCPLDNAFGTMAYAVSPKGAQQFMTQCFPLEHKPLNIAVMGKTIKSYTVDCLLNLHFTRWSSFVAVPPLVITQHDDAGSDTERRT